MTIKKEFTQDKWLSVFNSDKELIMETDALDNIIAEVL